MGVPRRPLVAGNWKMHGTLAEAVVLIRDLQARLIATSAASQYPSIDVVVAPPFTALALVAEQLNLIRVSDVHLPPRNLTAKVSSQQSGGLRLALAAQNMSEFDLGAFTGEISPLMLRELGVRWVIIGHSERRALYGELDQYVAAKVRAALNHGLTPIVAVGETLAQHEDGKAVEVVTMQTEAAFYGLQPTEVARCVVAYEPIWAIGTGRTDEPSNANATMRAIRACSDGLQDCRLLYGGSVKPENAAALFAQPDIDGALVGGASLDPQAFFEIIEAADSAGKVFQN